MSLDGNVAKAYGEWCADNVVRAITYRNIPCMKWVGDLWNYQQIIVNMRPSLIFEFGTAKGGSALWFADLMALVNPGGWVISFDIDGSHLGSGARHPQLLCEKWDTGDIGLRVRLTELRAAYSGPVFAILDSDHTKAHVLAEMELLRPILRSGDYLVVEDSCINGHPVYAGWGDGPFEAIEEYEQRHPKDYEHDRANEQRFGFTLAANGYLVRR